jgi:hypothetical protein
MLLSQKMIAVAKKEERRHSRIYWYLPVAMIGVSIVYVWFALAGAPKQIEETVTIDSTRHMVIPAGTLVASTRTLPVQERNVEAAGDCIAEATVYLKNRQTAAALRALHQAQAATNHALATRRSKGTDDKDLLTIANELVAVEHAIQKGALDDAARQLNALDNKLDALEH